MRREVTPLRLREPARRSLPAQKDQPRAPPGEPSPRRALAPPIRALPEARGGGRRGPWARHASRFTRSASQQIRPELNLDDTPLRPGDGARATARIRSRTSWDPPRRCPRRATPVPARPCNRQDAPARGRAHRRSRERVRGGRRARSSYPGRAPPRTERSPCPGPDAERRPCLRRGPRVEGGTRRPPRAASARPGAELADGGRYPFGVRSAGSDIRRRRVRLGRPIGGPSRVPSPAGSHSGRSTDGLRPDM